MASEERLLQAPLLGSIVPEEREKMSLKKEMMISFLTCDRRPLLGEGPCKRSIP
jgi:hypothetical protein